MVVGAEVVVDGSVELGPAVESVGFSVEGSSPSGSTLDPSDSVVSALPLPSVVPGAEEELEVSSVGLLVTCGSTVSSDGSGVVVGSGAAVSVGEGSVWAVSEVLEVSGDCSSSSVVVSGAREGSEVSKAGDDSVAPFSVTSVASSGALVVSGAAELSGVLVVWEATVDDPSSAASVVVFETLFSVVTSPSVAEEVVSGCDSFAAVVSG